jgi:hypothetical protein
VLDAVQNIIFKKKQHLKTSKKHWEDHLFRIKSLPEMNPAL